MIFQHFRGSTRLKDFEAEAKEPTSHMPRAATLMITLKNDPTQPGDRVKEPGSGLTYEVLSGQRLHGKNISVPLKVVQATQDFTISFRGEVI